MSCYILGLDHRGAPTGPIQFKAAHLVAHYKGVVIQEPEFALIPPGKVVVCVIEHYTFDAALVILTDHDLHYARWDTGGTPKTWVLLDAAEVYELVDDVYKTEPVFHGVA